MSGPVLYLAGQNTHGLIEKKLSQRLYNEKRIVYQGSRYLLTDVAQQALRYGEVVGIFISTEISYDIKLIRKFSLQDPLKPVTAFCLVKL